MPTADGPRLPRGGRGDFGGGRAAQRVLRARGQAHAQSGAGGTGLGGGKRRPPRCTSTYADLGIGCGACWLSPERGYVPVGEAPLN